MLRLINSGIQITNKDYVKKRFGVNYYILINTSKVVTSTGTNYIGILHAIADTREEAVEESNRLDAMGISNLIRKS